MPDIVGNNIPFRSSKITFTPTS